ncbi:N-acetylmuramoyl-L-alanine amidase [Streptomyces sp. NPDC001034]|uniref:N-acetylmuramoyl-L-alanine amidase n=1 Tax=Streptomyces sp. NPDC001034 TaxID=3154375 RepID=UPI003328BBB7
MATPMTASTFLDALHAEGVTIAETGNWQTHNRAGHGAWGPVNGVMIHHTAGTSGIVDYCYNGSAALPGPLCHGVIDKQGTVHLVGNGRANHAGGGDPRVLDAVIAESYGDRPPAPHQHEGSAGAVDGNARFYGFECVNLGDGHDPWPDAQLEAIERVAAAICRHHGWSAKSVIGHLEWSDWKSDPRGFDMHDMRARVDKRLGHTAAPAPTKPKPTAQKYEPFPGPAWFTTGRKSPIVAAMHDRLVAVGCNHYQSSKNKDVIGPGDVASYEAWQRKCGYSGSAASWPPGPTTWAKLHVPNS